MYKTKKRERRTEIRTDNLSGQLHQLEYEYGRFYETVADDVDLIEENENLKAENEVISSQVHTLTNDVMCLKQERYELERRIEDKDKELTEKSEQIATLNTELTQTKSLLKALQEKFDRVMEFIRNHSLKEKLEEFLKSVVKHKSR